LLDSSALLALFRMEKGTEAVEAVLDDAAISAVNLVEVTEVACRHGLDPARVTEWIGALDLPVLAFQPAMVTAAARLLLAYRKHGLSLGDCACLATAQTLGLPVLTADRAWRQLGLDLDIRLVR
jgi:PIN domain nuclease of toxin-antitoxin system